MLGRAVTKKLNSLKIPDGDAPEKASSTQYLRRDWHEKALFTESARRDRYKTSSFDSKC